MEEHKENVLGVPQCGYTWKIMLIIMIANKRQVFVCFMVYWKYPILYTVIQPRLQMQTQRHLWLFLLMSSENSPKPGTEPGIMLGQRRGSSYKSWGGPKSLLQQNLCQQGWACYNLLPWNHPLLLSPTSMDSTKVFLDPEPEAKWTGLTAIIPTESRILNLLMVQVSHDKLL